MSTEKPVHLKKLLAVAFVSTIPMGGEMQSAHVDAKGVTSIFPARLEPNGEAVVISSGQRADGLLVVRLQHDRLKNRHVVQQCFVPWSNVRGLEYGE